MILDITYPEGQVLFATTDTEPDKTAFIEALQYIEEQGLTTEDAKIVRRKNEPHADSILVVAKKEVRLKK